MRFLRLLYGPGSGSALEFRQDSINFKQVWDVSAS